MGVDKDIENALRRHVAAMLPLLSGTPGIAWPNDPFTKPNPPAPWLDIDVFANTNTRRAIKGDNAHIRQGIVQITVSVPKNTQTEVVRDLADEIAEFFPADLQLFENGVKVRIQRAPDVMSGAESSDGVWWEKPVSIPYESLI